MSSIKVDYHISVSGTCTTIHCEAKCLGIIAAMFKVEFLNSSNRIVASTCSEVNVTGHILWQVNIDIGN